MTAANWNSTPPLIHAIHLRSVDVNDGLCRAACPWGISKSAAEKPGRPGHASKQSEHILEAYCICRCISLILSRCILQRLQTRNEALGIVRNTLWQEMRLKHILKHILKHGPADSYADAHFERAEEGVH